MAKPRSANAGFTQDAAPAPTTHTEDEVGAGRRCLSWVCGLEGGARGGVAQLSPQQQVEEDSKFLYEQTKYKR